MKMDESRFDAEGNLKQGIFEDRFKSGSISCVGEYKDGEKTVSGSTTCLMES